MRPWVLPLLLGIPHKLVVNHNTVTNSSRRNCPSSRAYLLAAAVLSRSPDHNSSVFLAQIT